jgi:predicted SAM-dependent methyltransferase
VDTQTLKKLLRPAVAKTRRPAAQRRTRRLVAGESPAVPYRVEIGCGPTRRPGWVATDITWNAPYYLDGTKPWPFPAASVQYVYGDNVIEHLPLGPNRLLLRHAHEAMVPGGVIRLATPDVGRLVELYLACGPEAQALLAFHRQQGHVADHQVDVLRANFNEHGHHRGYLWDLESLSEELQAAGFKDPRRCQVGHSDDPVLRGLEDRIGTPEADVQLVVEARA